MTKQRVLIFKLPELFEILNELKDSLDFDLVSFKDKNELLNLKNNFKNNYLVLTNSENQIKGEQSQLIINTFPSSFHSIIEKINISFLKQKYSEQSDIVIGEYSIDINSRLIKKKNDISKKTQKKKQRRTPRNTEKHSFSFENETSPSMPVVFKENISKTEKL